jgi:hypothetical protein
MNLRKIANASTKIVNKNVEVTVRKYSSHTIAKNGKIENDYEEIATIAQIQPISSFKLQHLENYVQGAVYKAFYLNGDFRGLNRKHGGDFIKVGPDVYEVIEQPEGWDLTSGWTKVIGVLQ